MNRRTLLKGTGGLAASLLLTRSAHVFAQGTPAAGEILTLTITITDDGFEIPEGLTAGRYAVSVVNAGTTPSHSSLGRLPDGVTEDQVMADMSSGSEELPDWFLNAGYVGLPDWPAPGETRTGVVDLPAGNYFMFDPFSDRHAFVTVVEGGEIGPEPLAQATIEMTEMRFVLPESRRAGPARLKISNIGALPHEFQMLAVPEGTTADQIAALFAMPEDATPAPDDELAQGGRAGADAGQLCSGGRYQHPWRRTDELDRCGSRPRHLCRDLRAPLPGRCAPCDGGDARDRHPELGSPVSDGPGSGAASELAWTLVIGPFDRIDKLAGARRAQANSSPIPYD